MVERETASLRSVVWSESWDFSYEKCLACMVTYGVGFVLGRDPGLPKVLMPEVARQSVCQLGGGPGLLIR